MVDFSLLLDAGLAADPPQLPGAEGFALRMLEEGTATRSSLRVGEELEAIDARFSTAGNLDGAFAKLSVLRATLDEGLDIYADLLLHPAFSQPDFERLKRSGSRRSAGKRPPRRRSPYGSRRPCSTAGVMPMHRRRPDSARRRRCSA